MIFEVQPVSSGGAVRRNWLERQRDTAGSWSQRRDSFSAERQLANH
jgi:hypothetical protein